MTIYGKVRIRWCVACEVGSLHRVCWCCGGEASASRLVSSDGGSVDLLTVAAS